MARLVSGYPRVIQDDPSRQPLLYHSLCILLACYHMRSIDAERIATDRILEHFVLQSEQGALVGDGLTS